MTPYPPLLAAAFLAAAFLAGALSPAPSRAASSAWDETDFSAVRLVSATDAAGDSATLSLGLHFRLKKDWKVYWRSPGDAGYPPKPDWTGSDNLAAVTMHWPAPERFSVQDLETLGYKDAVLYPLSAAVAAPGRAVTLNAAVDYLACNEICVPFRAKLSLALPAGPAAPSAEAHDIARALAQVPGDGDGAAKGLGLGLGIDAAEAELRDGKTWLRVTATAQAGFAAPDIYAEGNADLRFGKPVVRLSADRRTAVLAVPVGGIKYLPSKRLDGEALTLTLADQGRAAEFRRTIAAATGPAALTDTAPGPALIAILGLAVLGGLILNLMPCVLPVLSLKLLSVIKHGASTPRTVRLSFLASAAGIVTAFLGLAAALAALKAGGALVGWGIQFQQPLFLIGMVMLLCLFAFNLWGFFEVRLPTAVYDLGEHSAHVHGLGGHFLSGAFATVLATPCSAPFLGTAVGFALARGTLEIFAVFAALGLGLSLPYLGVAAWPGVARLMPKPGAWMVTLRQVLGGALAATAVWLLSVLTIGVGAHGALAVGVAMAAGGGALWWGHRTGKPGWAAFAGAALIALSVPAVVPAPSPTVEPGGLTGVWRPFDAAQVPRLVAEGKTVFVDVTADWCITCQVNKAAVLDQAEIAAKLRGAGVVAMKADWTRPNDAIARYLASFGRYGIPFNAVYGPGAPLGVVLPELLSRGAVMDAFEKASGPAS